MLFRCVRRRRGRKKGKKERKRKEKDRTNVATELSEYLEREITGSALVLLLRTNSFGTSSNCVTFPVSIAGETCTSFTLNVKRKREKKKGGKGEKKVEEKLPRLSVKFLAPIRPVYSS